MEKLKLTRKKIVKETGEIYYNYILSYNGVEVAIKPLFDDGKAILKHMYLFSKNED